MSVLPAAPGAAERADADARSATQATALDPPSPFGRAISGAGFYLMGDYAAVVALEDRSLAIDPNAVACVWGASSSLPHVGRTDEAIVRAGRTVELGQRGPILAERVRGGAPGYAGKPSARATSP